MQRKTGTAFRSKRFNFVHLGQKKLEFEIWNFFTPP